MSQDRIPPGYYTPETLPPLSEGARKILASVTAGVARLRAERGGEGPVRIEIEAVAEGIRLSDEGLPGFSLEDWDRMGGILKGDF